MVENSVWVSEHRRARLLKKLQAVGWGWEQHRTMDILVRFPKLELEWL